MWSAFFHLTRFLLWCRLLSGACTGPDIGPVQAFRRVFACMGPVDGPVRALATRCGYRANLICTGNRSQNGACETSNLRVSP